MLPLSLFHHHQVAAPITASLNWVLKTTTKSLTKMPKSQSWTIPWHILLWPGIKLNLFSIQPNVQLDFLACYLSLAKKCFVFITIGNDAKHLHFIAPILICVCNFFEGDVAITVKEDLVGNFVNAQRHFEFMLGWGRKANCIILAKQDNLEPGMAQELVGCKVAAEVGGLDVVYGIVTNAV